MNNNLLVRKDNNLWEYLTWVFVVFILGLFPLLVGPKGYQNITFFKYAVFRASTIAFAALVLIIFLYSGIRKEHILKERNKEIPFKISTSQIICIIYMLWGTMSALLSPFGKDTWIGQGRFEGLLSIYLYGFAFLFISLWAEHSMWYHRAVTFSSIVFSLIAIEQFFHRGIIYPDNYWFWDAHFMSTIGNVDMVAGLCAACIPVMVCSYVIIEQKYWDYALLLGTILMTFCGAIGDADSGKVGLLVGFVIALPYLVDSKNHIIRLLEVLCAFTLGLFLKNVLNLSANGISITVSKKTLFFLGLSIIFIGISILLGKLKFKINYSAKKIAIITWTILIVFSLICIVFVFFYKGNLRLLVDASEILHGKMSDSAGSGRGYIWKHAVLLAKEKPFFGSGPGTFMERYKKYESFKTITDFAHNDLLQIAVCEGFGGMIIYILFCASLCYTTLKYALKNKYIIIYGSACAAYLVHSCFSFSLAIITPLFWVMAGIVEKLAKQTNY